MSGKTIVKIAFAALLAGTAAGCSSDVTRFGGVFSSDNITTNSIPRRQITGLNGQIPVPDADVAAGTLGNAQPINRSQALSQPMPGRQQTAYDPVSTSTIAPSSARIASSPIKVERVALADPTTKTRQTALAQPMPPVLPKKKLTPVTATDPITTSTARTEDGGWTVDNAPSVIVKPGENLEILSRRFGVPPAEILHGNGLKSALSIRPGQKLLIPYPTHGGNLARQAAQTAALPKGQQPLPPLPADGGKVAVLPTAQNNKGKPQPDANQKLASVNGKVPGQPVPGAQPAAQQVAQADYYVVKPGDSLAKIAKETNTPIDQLKKMNGLGAASIRIGQKLKLSAHAQPDDALKTASIPAKPAAPTVQPKPVQTASAQPEAYKPPVAAAAQPAKDAVTDVAKADNQDAAPRSTGIGKYRWPVRGAVVAGYGANVDGNRNDGIDISVPQGTEVKAAENGVVIYAGNGLKELGNTVLVRHDDGTVTVYGHADSLNVTRGQKVTRGQTLALSGMSGNVKRPLLHFEVRKDATPVNPMTFLE